MVKSIIRIIIIVFAIVFSGCVKSVEPIQEIPAAPNNSSVPNNSFVPAPTIKNIDIHAQLLVIDITDIKKTLGRDWIASGSGPVMDIPKWNYKTMVNPRYESGRLNRTGGSIQYYAMIQVMVFNNTTAAKRANMAEINIGEENPSNTNIGFFEVKTSDGNIIIKSVRTNVVTCIWISRVLYPGTGGKELSYTEKTEMLSIDKVIDLAKIQDEKISKILGMLK